MCGQRRAAICPRTGRPAVPPPLSRGGRPALAPAAQATATTPRPPPRRYGLQAPPRIGPSRGPILFFPIGVDHASLTPHPHPPPPPHPPPTTPFCPPFIVWSRPFAPRRPALARPTAAWPRSWWGGRHPFLAVSPPAASHPPTVGRPGPCGGGVCARRGGGGGGEERRLGRRRLWWEERVQRRSACAPHIPVWQSRGKISSPPPPLRSVCHHSPPPRPLGQPRA